MALLLAVYSGKAAFRLGRPLLWVVVVGWVVVLRCFVLNLFVFLSVLCLMLSVDLTALILVRKLVGVAWRSLMMKLSVLGCAAFSVCLTRRAVLLLDLLLMKVRLLAFGYLSVCLMNLTVLVCVVRWS